jgi:hypothetical protein
MDQRVLPPGLTDHYSPSVVMNILDTTTESESLDINAMEQLVIQAHRAFSSDTLGEPARVAELSWDDVQVGALLGMGSFSLVHSATLKNPLLLVESNSISSNDERSSTSIAFTARKPSITHSSGCGTSQAKSAW